ncbi:MAG: hypothetical protein ABR500_06010 [Dermatophilaceae bacterium]|nr:hypothetical protein [Intrasporangiaceae bacterium]
MTSRTGRVARRPGRYIAAAVGIALVVVLLSACAASPNAAASGSNEAGFLLGLWHGLIAPIAFLVSLFNDAVGIYEVDNTGGWYDFGFLVGVSIFFSGGGAGAGGRSRGKRR